MAAARNGNSAVTRMAAGNGNGNGNGHREMTSSDLAPFDLDAAVAAQGEAEAVPFAFTFAGQEYQIPPQSTWKMSTLALLGNGDIQGALTDLIGEDGYDRLVDDGMTLAHLNALFEQASKVSGTGDLGNSSRSARRVSSRT